MVPQPRAPFSAPLASATLLLLLGAGLLGPAAPAWAQRKVPKIGMICPLGYVDTLNEIGRAHV